MVQLLSNLLPLTFFEWYASFVPIGIYNITQKINGHWADSIELWVANSKATFSKIQEATSLSHSLL